MLGYVVMKKLIKYMGFLQKGMSGMKFYYVKCEILKRYAEFIVMFESNS